MGKLDSTGTLAQTRGRQGGVVVSSNATGSYARAWFMPRNSRTPAQLAWARKWNEWARAWASLTSLQRGDWETASQSAVWTRSDWFGQPYQPSGLNLWMMIAAIRDALGLALSVTPPGGSAPTAAITCTMNLTARDPVTFAHLCFLNLAQGPPAVWTYVQIEGSWLNSSDGAARNKPYRPLAAAAFPSTLFIDATPRASEVVGWLVNETRCWFRWRGLSANLIPGPWLEGYGTTGLD